MFPFVLINQVVESHLVRRFVKMQTIDEFRIKISARLSYMNEPLFLRVDKSAIYFAPQSQTPRDATDLPLYTYGIYAHAEVVS